MTKPSNRGCKRLFQHPPKSRVRRLPVEQHVDIGLIGAFERALRVSRGFKKLTRPSKDLPVRIMCDGHACSETARFLSDDLLFPVAYILCLQHLLLSFSSEPAQQNPPSFDHLRESSARTGTSASAKFMAPDELTRD